MPAYENIKLADVAEVYSGFAFKSEYLIDKGIPVLKIANINQKVVNPLCAQYFPEEKVTQKLQRYFLESNDVLVAMTGQGSLGRIGKMIKKDGKYLVNQRVGIVRAKDKGDIPEYLYSVLALDTYEKQLYGLGLGAGQPNVSAKDIGNLDIPYPKKETRKIIAEIHSAYDNLIENNNRRIAILEEMAQSLYREWFIKFRFPGYQECEFKESSLGLIPERWKVKRFSSLVDYKTGKLNSNAAVDDGEYPFFTCSRETYKTNTWSFECECVLLAGNNANAIYPIKYFEGKFDAYQRTYVITEKNREEITPSFLYYSLSLKLNHLKSISTGSATKFLTKGILDDLEFVVPHPSLMKDFDVIGLELLKLQNSLNKKNEYLRSQRDLLLPKLISGAIKLQD